VVRRGGKKRPSTKPNQPQPNLVTQLRDREKKMALQRWPAPQTFAETIDRQAGEGASHAAVMKKVAREVDLDHLGVTVSTTRKTKARGILLEVGSPEEAKKLAQKVRTAVGNAA